MAIGQKSEIISHGIDAYDAIQCIIDWEMPDGSHFTETILTSWVDPETSTAASDQKIKFVGSKGRYEADQKERGIRLNNDEHGVEHINPDFCMPYGYENGRIQWRGYGIDSITTFLDDVLKLEQNEISLQDLQTKRPSFQESLISTAVIEAAHLSLENDSNWQSLESWLLN
jgi:predicted dehydrogenase